MIDVKKTILNTIVSQVNEMRFHAHDDPKCWKKLIYLTMLDDIYEWSIYRDDCAKIQTALEEKRTDFILKNPMFGIEYKPTRGVYTNVNTPQPDITWGQVQEITDGGTLKDITLDNLEYTPDYNCNQDLVYLPYADKIKMGDEFPEVIKTLTTCEKMNIYVDTETNKAFYLDPSGEWKLLNTNSNMSEKDVVKLIKKHEDKGVKFKFETLEDKTALILDTPSEDFSEELPEDEIDTATIPVVTGDNTDILNELL